MKTKANERTNATSTNTPPAVQEQGGTRSGTCGRRWRCGLSFWMGDAGIKMPLKHEQRHFIELVTQRQPIVNLGLIRRP